MPTPEQVKKAGHAIMRDLCKIKGYSHGCLLMFKPLYPENVCVRGHIDCYALAIAALKAIEPKKKRRRGNEP